ncbi:hypothetical protein KJ909_02370 [Patescibacteria group bacterium]|nr:hypothetical protein [Patescibacteria group bacterium]
MKLKLFLLFLFCFFALVNLTRYHSPSPQANQPQSSLTDYLHPPLPQTKNFPPPALSSPNYIVIDTATNTVLLSKNPHQQIFPASITKLASAITALNIYSLDEVVNIDQDYTEGKIMGLSVGEKISVRSLVYALLVHSANDAALALANHHPQGLSGFVAQMNLIAQKYQLADTHFVNPDGIHHPDHYSTVYDLSQLGRLAIKNPIVLDTVKKQKLTVTNIDQSISHYLESTNELLGVVPQIEGLKTGWTPEAGGCFVALINLDGHYLISVVAQSEDRFADTRLLLDWAKANLSWSDYSI